MNIEAWILLKDFPLYEVNQYGEVRNRKTKHIKKPHEAMPDEG